MAKGTLDDVSAERVSRLRFLSEWNQKNLFCGWYDADLSEKGLEEAKQAGRVRPFTDEKRRRGTLLFAVFLVVERERLHVRCGVHVGVETCRQDSLQHPAGTRSALDPCAPSLASQRAYVRRPAGKEQGRDGC